LKVVDVLLFADDGLDEGLVALVLFVQVVGLLVDGVELIFEMVNVAGRCAI
jgi:hypothetical protein